MSDSLVDTPVVEIGRKTLRGITVREVAVVVSVALSCAFASGAVVVTQRIEATNTRAEIAKMKDELAAESLARAKADKEQSEIMRELGRTISDLAGSVRELQGELKRMK